MRLTKQTNYAFRVLMYCGANAGRKSRIPEVARAFSVSEPFLFKIVQLLSEAGLVQTTRGRGGGIALGRPADEITLLDVVRVTEDGFVMAECFDGGAADCPLIDHCALNAALRRALGAFMEVLDETTIDDLVRSRPELGALIGLTDDGPALPLAN
ncbi:MAG: iron-responsive transcriptional regulator RirA [Salaquimonas sp.]|jgi:Rrf2 family iron-responsive transcriptional regulator|nr:iron-responsive transcriptional regulator RirA [Salaquimonas sp.]